MISIKNFKRFLLVSVLISLLAGIFVAFLPETAVLYGMSSGFVIIAILAGITFWAINTDLLTVQFKRNARKGFENRKQRKAYSKAQKAVAKEMKKKQAAEILKSEQDKIKAFLNANPNLK